MKKDARNSFKNPVIVIVLLTLMILPSLYAILNVQACWDPYGKTGNLEFAVVNLDENSSYNGISYNFGDKLIDRLHDNNDYNWIFTNENDARNGVKSGKYYSAIIIPENFTKNVLSISTANPQPAHLEFLENEKISPVGSRMSETASKEVQTKVNNEIVQTVNTEALGQLVTVGSSLPVTTPLTELSGVNSSGVKNYFYSPVGIEKTSIYPVDNYGSSVAPFYISLALWIGAIMAGIIIKTRYIEKQLYTPIEMYFGRMGLYLMLGIGQALVITIGCFLAGVEVTNPLLFLLTMILSSMVCMVIIYSFVSVFGIVGKALSIVVLVFQISGTGGVYPIQIMASFFGVANAWLPLTYCIDALREVMLGMYWPSFSFAILKLLIYPIITLVLSVIIKYRFDKSAHWFEKKLEESGLA